MLDKLKSQSSERLELQKQLRQNSPLFVVFLLLLFAVIVAVVVYLYKPLSVNSFVKENRVNKFAQINVVSTPTPTPTPRPLTFAEMNSLYGPCIRLPVLMYHHIQTKESAAANHQTSLTVSTDIFKTQMQYLKDKGYNATSINDLVNFFDNGTPVPPRSVLLTFDDGYQDFYTDAFPILQNLGFKATMFLPTGLMNNPGYLSWDEVLSMNGLIFFANHTWSHKSVVTQTSVMEREISTADTQLNDHGLNSLKVFAYPYGPDSVSAETYLDSLGYKAAFTTVPGSILCKKQRLSLPRLRIGNVSLSFYGF